MLILKSLGKVVAALAALALVVCGSAAFADGVQVVFDLPDTIECRDATPPEFAAAHSSLKVIEAKFRVSARFLAGDESEIVEFLYIVIASPDKRLRFQDYVPNTTLESTAADDHIEVTDTTENSQALEGSAKVGYKVLGLGVSKNKGTKKTESNHYKQLAPKALVVSSGTTDREHGLFFKLRPSRAGSLEGAKEFKFLATVPKTWRGDWCTISCAARAKGRSFLARSVIVPAGVEQTQVGLYMAGDAEASALGEELRRVQDAHASVLAAQMAKDQDPLLETMYSAVSTQAVSDYAATLCGFFRSKKSEPQDKIDPDRKKLDDAHRAVIDVQNRLRHLAQ